MILGLGATGLSYARFLARGGDDFIVMDDAAHPARVAALGQLRLAATGKAPGESHQPVEGHQEVLGIDQEILLEAEEIFVSPGVPLDTPALSAAFDAGIPLRGDVGMFGALATAPIVAITGTNGKSTVTDLVYQMAETQRDHVRVAGNIGTPCLDVLDDNAALYLLEVSSYQLELAPQFQPEVAVVLNLSPDHLDRYESTDAYYQVKLGLYRYCRVAVVNRDLVADRGFELAGPERTITFGSDQPRAADEFGVARRGDTDVLMLGSRELLTSHELLLTGRHNVLNVLAALALGRAVDLDLEAMLDTAREYRGLPHRGERLGEVGGVTYINDSKATNPGATLAAVRGHARGRNIVLILGGEAKGVSFDALAGDLADQVKVALLIGKARQSLRQAMGALIPCVDCATLEEAVAGAAKHAGAGDVVLLAPGCASFDMFAGYADRGDTFKRLVQEVMS